MSEKQSNFELADLELVKQLKTCHLNGQTDILPANPQIGDIWEYMPIGKTIIYTDKWYELPDLKAASEKKNDGRNEIVDELFKLADWPDLPKEFQDTIARAIDQIELDGETIYLLNRDIARLKVEIKTQNDITMEPSD